MDSEDLHEWSDNLLDWEITYAIDHFPADCVLSSCCFSIDMFTKLVDHECLTGLAGYNGTTSLPIWRLTYRTLHAVQIFSVSLNLFEGNMKSYPWWNVHVIIGHNVLLNRVNFNFTLTLVTRWPHVSSSVSLKPTDQKVSVSFSLTSKNGF